MHSALSHRTVARVLRLLAGEEQDDPLIDLVSPRRMARADRYALRIPDRYADSARWRRRRAGRVEAIHPVFLALGGPAGLVYGALGQDAARGAEVARAAQVVRVGDVGALVGCSLSTGSPSAARAAGAAAPAPWPTWPSRPARPA